MNRALLADENHVVVESSSAFASALAGIALFYALRGSHVVSPI
jgi:hypothetical protein